MQTLIRFPSGHRLVKLGTYAFALFDRLDRQHRNLAPCPLLAMQADKVGNPVSAYDGNGKPGQAYVKPLSYTVSVLASPRMPSERLGEMFNHCKAAEASQAGLAKYKELCRTRRGRRALRTILHAREMEAKAKALQA